MLNIKKMIKVFGLCLCWSSTCQAATGGERLALLIGNADYAGRDKLDNPVNDVQDYGLALKAAGFSVQIKTNLKRQELFEAVSEFGKRVEKVGGLALLHYAGHGVAVDNENYVVPIGATIGQGDERLASDSLAVKQLVKLLGSRPDRVNVVILDMCRSIPGRGMRGEGGGLAPMKAAGGTLLAFSTQFGHSAGDGSGQRNSPYARQLIAALGQPDLTVIDYFSEVRGGVMRETGGKQSPVEENRLLGRAPIFAAVK